MNGENKHVSGYLILSVMVLGGLAVYLSNQAIEKAQIMDSEAAGCRAQQLLKQDGYRTVQTIKLPSGITAQQVADNKSNRKASGSCTDAEKYNLTSRGQTPIMTNDAAKNKKLEGKGQVYYGEGAATCIEGQLSFRETRKGLPLINIYAICEVGYKLGECTKSIGTNEICTCVKSTTPTDTLKKLY